MSTRVKKILAAAEGYFIQKGKQEGRALMLQNMLKVKFSGLPGQYVKKINRADANTLNQWCINFVNAQLLDEVFG